MAFLDELRWDAHGLVPVILQDEATHEVLMLGWANREALQKTIETREAHFWSRSRGKLWKKGETSGHVQRVKELRVDCDGDAVLAVIDRGGPACHEGYRSCFFRRLEPLALDGKLGAVGPREFDPRQVYGPSKARPDPGGGHPSQ